jgi:hypothetical protein
MSEPKDETAKPEGDLTEEDLERVAGGVGLDPPAPGPNQPPAPIKIVPGGPTPEPDKRGQKLPLF